MYLRIALILASVLLFSGRAAAESERIRILYRADDGCPSESAFQHEVLGRTSIARISADATSVRVFEVELLRSGPRVVGSLVIHERDGATVARRFTGRNCRDVAKVLALATALAVDPRAELAASEPAVPDEPAATKPPATKQPTSGAPSSAVPPRGEQPARSSSDAADTEDGSDATDTDAPSDAPTDVPAARDPSATPSRTGSDWARHVSLGARAAFGVGPRPAFGAVLTFGASQISGNFPFTIDVGAVWLDAIPTELKGAEARFTFLAGRPQLCLEVFHPVQQLTVSPCIAAELGLVTAAGSNLPHAETHQQFWATGEALLRFQLTLSDSWFLVLDSGAALPLTRYHYVFNQPETSIYATPAVALGITLGAGIRF